MLKKAERLLFSADPEARPALAQKIAAQITVFVRSQKWNVTFMRKYGTMKVQDCTQLLTNLVAECDAIQMEELKDVAALLKKYLCTPRVDRELLDSLNQFLSADDRAFCATRDEVELSSPFLTAHS